MKCAFCGEEGADKLRDIEKITAFKLFDKVPYAVVCKLWYEQGFKPSDAICPDCFPK